MVQHPGTKITMHSRNSFIPAMTGNGFLTAKEHLMVLGPLYDILKIYSPNCNQ